VVFRTELVSDSPPFRGALHRLPDPVPREGRAVTRPTGEEKPWRWAPFMFREHVFFSSQPGNDETNFKKCQARVRYVSVPPGDLIGRHPSPRALPPTYCAPRM
jgi:hypothetical protein